LATPFLTLPKSSTQAISKPIPNLIRMTGTAAFFKLAPLLRVASRVVLSALSRHDGHKIADLKKAAVPVMRMRLGMGFEMAWVEDFGSVRKGVANAWRALLLLGVAFALVACGGARNAAGNDVNISASAPSAPLNPGDTVVFTMTVQNIGSSARRTLRLSDQLGAFLVLTGFTCQSNGGAVCPDTPSVAMTIASLPPGGVLIFQVQRPPSTRSPAIR